MKKYHVFLASEKDYPEIILLTYPSRSHWGIFSSVLYIFTYENNKNKCLLGRSIYTYVLWVANGMDDEISFNLQTSTWFGRTRILPSDVKISEVSCHMMTEKKAKIEGSKILIFKWIIIPST